VSITVSPCLIALRSVFQTKTQTNDIKELRLSAATLP